MRFLSRFIHRETGPFTEIRLKIRPEIHSKIVSWTFSHAWLVNKSLKQKFVRSYQFISPFFNLIKHYYRVPRPTHSFLLILLRNPLNSEEFHFLALHRRCQIEIEDFQWRLSEETIQKLLENAKKYSVEFNENEMKNEEKEEKSNEEEICMEEISFKNSMECQLKEIQEENVELNENNNITIGNEEKIQESENHQTMNENNNIIINENNTNQNSQPISSFYSPDPTGPAPPGLTDSAIVESIYHIHPISYPIIPYTNLSKLHWTFKE